ncbi:glycosyltransferase [Bacillus freudenreichii]|nr:glycosyltransferase [Bacillus freudenreichii]
MNDYAVYFMLHSIDKVRGGMTRAAIRRAKMLSRFYDAIGLITFDFNPDYDHVIQHYKELGLWDDKIRHYNVYEFFMNESTAIPEDHTHILDLDVTSKKVSLFDREGRPRKVAYYDKPTGKAIGEQLFTKDGRCFFKRHFEPTSHVWLDQSGNTRKSFKKVRDYRHHFIHSLIENKDSVLLSDSRFTDKILMGVKDNKVARMAVLHSNHLQSPYQYGSTLVKRNELLFDQMNKLDAVVTLTESQAEDIGSRFGRRSTIHTVGHPANVPAENHEKNDSYIAVMLARYRGIKQISHAIKAFKKVVQTVPEAMLEIWGFGEEEDKYKRLVKRLRLEDHVFIKGFTNDIEGIYRKAAFSLITSKSEAFGMSIIESMSVGTPVICYACKYGPTDIITHGQNGLLVEPGDVKGLANAMIELYSNEEKRRTLSHEAMKITKIFGEEKLADRWRAIFEEARKQRGKRVYIREIKAEFTNVTFNETDGIKVEGKAQLKGFDPAFRDKMILFLQLRKGKDMEDLYAPLAVSWDSQDTLSFKGVFADFHKLHRGRWDVKLSVSCLNYHEFVHPKLPSSWRVSGNGNIKVSREGQHVMIKVYRPKKKQAFNSYYLIEKYKAKIRDFIRKA